MYLVKANDLLVAFGVGKGFEIAKFRRGSFEPFLTIHLSDSFGGVSEVRVR